MFGLGLVEGGGRHGRRGARGGRARGINKIKNLPSIIEAFTGCFDDAMGSREKVGDVRRRVDVVNS